MILNRFSNFCALVLALGFGFFANAGQEVDQYQEIQSQAPCTKWCKRIRPKQTSSQNLPGHVRRHRKHTEIITTTVTTSCENDQRTTWDSGSEDSEEFPYEKSGPCQQAQLTWQDEPCGKELAHKKTARCEAQTTCEPRMTRENRVRNHYQVLDTEEVNTTRCMYTTEWSSSSEEDVDCDSSNDGCAQEQEQYNLAQKE